MAFSRPVRRAIAVLLALFAAGCTNSGTPPPAVEPPTVLVAAPVENSVTDYVDYTGRTDAPEFLEVRARVSGYLTKISDKFTAANREVKTGEMLFEIDPRPYEAELGRMKAQVALAEAQLIRAKADVARNRPLVATGAVTQQELDKLVADEGQAAASVEAAKKAVDSADLDVKFCTVTAQIPGRLSRNYITLGNLVTKDTTLLTTIVSQDPMYVYFDVDERTVLRVQELIRQGKYRSARRHVDVPVKVGLANEGDRYPHDGVINFVDNRLDPTTGTMKVRAELPNPVLPNEDRRFTAGLFVRVRVPLGEARKALLVSERAVGTDQGQKFVFVVTDKNEVQAQPVTLGQMHDGLRVVEAGLKGGEKLITVGLQRVRPGTAVTPKPGEMIPTRATDRPKAVMTAADAPKADGRTP